MADLDFPVSDLEPVQVALELVAVLGLETPLAALDLVVLEDSAVVLETVSAGVSMVVLVVDSRPAKRPWLPSKPSSLPSG